MQFNKVGKENEGEGRKEGGGRSAGQTLHPVTTREVFPERLPDCRMLRLSWQSVDAVDRPTTSSIYT